MEYSDVIGSQFTWIACDKNGHIGAFNIAGNGKVPQQVFYPKDEFLHEVEDFIFESKLICETIKCHPIYFDKEFADISRRGIFCYDWTCIYHTNEGDAYEKICEPTAPITIQALSQHLQSYINTICFSTLEFYSSNKIDVNIHFDIAK